MFLGNGNALGCPIPLAAAESHVFGLCLLNDWSARDIQAWEYQPLGPFLAKNFATTLSPWIVSLQALAPFRVPFARAAGDPTAAGYLASESNDEAGGFDIRLEALFAERLDAGTPRSRPSGSPSTSFRHSYWTIAQMIAHHTINGCNLRAGDLLGTGTQSGPTPAEAGSLLELSSGGGSRSRIGSGEQRTFLEDGDTVMFRAWCAKAGAARIGFGEARGRVLPADGGQSDRAHRQISLDLDLPRDLDHSFGWEIEAIHYLRRVAVQKREERDAPTPKRAAMQACAPRDPGRRRRPPGRNRSPASRPRSWLSAARQVRDLEESETRDRRATDLRLHCR